MPPTQSSSPHDRQSAELAILIEGDDFPGLAGVGRAPQLAIGQRPADKGARLEAVCLQCAVGPPNDLLPSATADFLVFLFRLLCLVAVVPGVASRFSLRSSWKRARRQCADYHHSLFTAPVSGAAGNATTLAVPCTCCQGALVSRRRCNGYIHLGNFAEGLRELSTRFPLSVAMTPPAAAKPAHSMLRELLFLGSSLRALY